jgi:galactokinase
MTGGGFGGCVVALVPQGRVDEIRTLVNREYPAQTGLTAGIFVCTASQGAEQILA